MEGKVVIKTTKPSLPKAIKTLAPKKREEKTESHSDISRSRHGITQKQRKERSEDVPILQMMFMIS